MSKEQGLFQKYKVQKINDPKKYVDCICLEFDDPVARIAIKVWAEEMHSRGYTKLYDDVSVKLKRYEKDVHTEHCCIEHGCKYGDENCSVVTMQKSQSFLCEDCNND